MVKARAQVADGTYTADSSKTTVKDACDLWLEGAEAERLERSTIDQYRRSVARGNGLITFVDSPIPAALGRRIATRFSEWRGLVHML